METTDNQVVQNSDFLHKSDVKWFSDIKYQEPDEHELKLLEGTISSKDLVQLESVEPQIYYTDEQKKRMDIIKIKIVALDKMNEHPLVETHLFSNNKKKELIEHMQWSLDMFNDEFIIFNTKFNQICQDRLFTQICDYSSFPIYK